MSSRAKTEQDLKELLSNCEIMEMSIVPLARLYYLRYDALIKEGFSAKDSLAIVIHRGLE